MHNWLKYYVMLRLMDRKKPRGQMQLVPMLLTFIVSAVWHGPRIGFLILFIGLAFKEYFFKTASRTKIVIWIGKNVPYFVYAPIRLIYNYGTLSYLCVAFQKSKFEHFNFIHRNLYYFCYWSVPLSVLIVTYLPKERSQKPAATT